MSLLKKSTSAFMIGGIFFMIPVLVIIVLVTKAIHLLTPVGKKLTDIFHLHSVFGTAAATLVCIILILLICYLGGLLIRTGLLRQWNSKMEEKLFLFFPGLQMLKYRLLGEQHVAFQHHWTAILLKDNNFYRIAFITHQHNENLMSVFLPDAPKMDAGEIRYVWKKDCEYITISMQQAMNSLNSFGRDMPVDTMLEDKNTILDPKL